MQINQPQICDHAFYLKRGSFLLCSDLNIYINEATFIFQGEVKAGFSVKH